MEENTHTQYAFLKTQKVGKVGKVFPATCGRASMMARVLAIASSIADFFRSYGPGHHLGSVRAPGAEQGQVTGLR